jgi:K+-sensing histidine kinase KdpD
MRLLKAAAPIALSLAIIFTVSVILAHFKNIQHNAQHLVFFYLLPTAFVAILCGSVLAMFCAFAATLIAAFFLYEPIYSLYVSKPLEIGELIFFAVTASIGAKCMAELTRPSEQTHE